LVLLFLLLLPLAALGKSPDIVLKDLDGRDANVNQYIGKGKWVVVAIWAHDCPICNAEIYQMTFFHDEHYKKDAMVLGVSIDGYENKDKALAFIDRHAINFPNLIAEPDASVLAKFGAGPFIGTPTFYLYTPEGELAAKQVGPATQEDIENFMAKYAKTGAL
jgi:peroxiredoxin